MVVKSLRKPFHAQTPAPRPCFDKIIAKTLGYIRNLSYLCNEKENHSHHEDN